VPFNYYGIRFFSRITNVLGGGNIILYLLLAVGFLLVLSRAGNQGVGWLLVVAIVVGIIGPGVVGYVYEGAGSRVLMSMARTGYVPGRLAAVSKKHEIPIGALMAIAIVGAILALRCRLTLLIRARSSRCQRGSSPGGTGQWGRARAG
jgi:amino acid transporter